MKHKPILFKKIANDNIISDTPKTLNNNSSTTSKINNLFVISVGGACDGIGCTHTSIHIAHYLTRYINNCKVAILQLNNKKDFQSFSTFSNKKAKNENSFKYHDIDFYYDTSFLNIKKLKYYDYCILDIGRLKRETNGNAQVSEHYDLMHMADIPIFVCGNKPWQYRDMALTIFKPNIFNFDSSNNTYEQLIDDYDSIRNWKFIFNFSDSEFYSDANNFISKYWSTYNLPCNQDLFRINSEEDDLFYNILRPVLT